MDSMLKKYQESLNTRELAMKPWSYRSSISISTRVKVCFAITTLEYFICLFSLTLTKTGNNLYNLYHKWYRITLDSVCHVKIHFLSCLFVSNENVLKIFYFLTLLCILLSCERLAFLFVACRQSTVYSDLHFRVQEQVTWKIARIQENPAVLCMHLLELDRKHLHGVYCCALTSYIMLSTLLFSQTINQT